jgi:hypothetical protein
MATKKEHVTWIANNGKSCTSELEALTVDFDTAVYLAGLDASDPDCTVSRNPALTSDVLAAIDALHEYAHREDKTKAPVYRAKGVAVWGPPGDCPR